MVNGVVGVGACVALWAGALLEMGACAVRVNVWESVPVIRVMGPSRVGGGVFSAFACDLWEGRSVVDPCRGKESEVGGCVCNAVGGKGRGGADVCCGPRVWGEEWGGVVGIGRCGEETVECVVAEGVMVESDVGWVDAMEPVCGVCDGVETACVSVGLLGTGNRLDRAGVSEWVIVSM